MPPSHTSEAAPAPPNQYGSMSRDRRWALRWSYFFLMLFAIFFLTAADLHVDHLAQDQRGDLGGDQSVVGLQSDARQLHRAADLDAIPHLLPQLGAGLGASS